MNILREIATLIAVIGFLLAVFIAGPLFVLALAWLIGVLSGAA